MNLFNNSWFIFLIFVLILLLVMLLIIILIFPSLLGNLNIKPIPLLPNPERKISIFCILLQ